MASPPLTSPQAADGEALLDSLEEARSRTLGLVQSLDDAQLEQVHSKLMSPLVWDLGHIAAFEDLWLVHRFAGRPMIRRDLADVYDAFETPRAGRGELPHLDAPAARAYLEEVRAVVTEATGDLGPGDGLRHELVIRHEHQHCETMLQTLNLARIDGYEPPRPLKVARARTASTGLDLVPVDGGPFELGACAEGFAYDNERPCHEVDVPAFGIGRTPITNATFLHFVEGGGYQRRTLWTHEAWQWKEQYDITHPLNWTDDGREWRLGGIEPLDPHKPVVHVSWFEAEAFARAHDARLPTEVEWEKAATWDQADGTTRSLPWGDEPTGPRHANLDLRMYGTTPVGSFPDGVAASGCEGMLGDVWEWTSSDFDGYPGFRAHPYREYSEVFFGGDWRVLRGGSWATRRRVATPSFRNWDHPQRRQIFSGLRIASDA